jgi:hypothetical protein
MSAAIFDHIKTTLSSALCDILASGIPDRNSGFSSFGQCGWQRIHTSSLSKQKTAPLRVATIREWAETPFQRSRLSFFLGYERGPPPGWSDLREEITQE